MYYYACHSRERDRAAKGQYRFYQRSTERAPMNIHATENSVELLVFAPGRIKEHFKLEVVGEDLKITYTPPENFPRPNWVHREYSRGGFERIFGMNGKFDSKNISARYEDGVLYVTLPRVNKEEGQRSEIKIS